MKRRFKRQVHYLPSQTYGIVGTSNTAAMVGAGNSNIALTNLLLDLGQQPADVQLMNNSMYGRQEFYFDNIVHSISGKVGWAINGKVSGQTQASGIAGIAVRAAIFSVALGSKVDTTAPDVPLSGGVAEASLLPDIAQANLSLWAQQSRITPSMKVYWTQTWYANVDFGAQTQLNAESFAPPTNRVSTHAKRRLRWNDQLYVAIQYSVVNLNSLLGATQITLAPSLLVAASRVRARR